MADAKELLLKQKQFDEESHPKQDDDQFTKVENTTTMLQESSQNDEVAIGIPVASSQVVDYQIQEPPLIEPGPMVYPGPINLVPFDPNSDTNQVYKGILPVNF